MVFVSYITYFDHRSTDIVGVFHSEQEAQRRLIETLAEEADVAVQTEEAFSAMPEDTIESIVADPEFVLSDFIQSYRITFDWYADVVQTD